jgi:hypothetical protein
VDLLGELGLGERVQPLGQVINFPGRAPRLQAEAAAAQPPDYRGRVGQQSLSLT